MEQQGSRSCTRKQEDMGMVAVCRIPNSSPIKDPARLHTVLKLTLYVPLSVGGFWIAEGFNPAQMQVPSSAVALGLNPGLAMVACLIGNLLVTGPVCVVGWLGSKVSL